MPVSTSGTAIEPDIAVARDGTVIVVWRLTTGAVQASVRPPGGGFSAPKTLGSAVAGPRVATDAAGTAIAIWRDGANTIQTAIRPARGAFGGTTPMPSGGSADGTPAIAMNAGGTAVAAWDIGTAIRTRVRPAGGTFGQQTDHASDASDASLPSLAIGDGGVIVLVWLQKSSLEAQARIRFNDANWHPSAAPDVLGSATATEPAATVDGTGNSTAVWRSDTAVVQEALRVQGGDGFATAMPLSGSDADAPDIAGNAAGAATAVWAQGATNPVIRSASRQQPGTFTGTQPLSAGGAASTTPQVDVAPAGTAFAVWSRLNGASNVVQGIARAPGAAFGAVQNLSNAFLNSTLPRVDSDGLGNAAAVWQDNTGHIQVAGYDGAPPRLNASVPPTAIVGNAVGMSAATSDTWSPVTVRWNFGDGATGAGPAVSHAYGRTGIFNVTVTATDGVGNAVSATRPILIAARFVPPPPETPKIESPVFVTWGVNEKRIYLLRLKVTKVPKGGKVQLRCKGRKCPFRRSSSSKRRKRAITLYKEIKASKVVGNRKRSFHAGQRLQLRVTAPGFIGKVVNYKLRKGKIPSGRVLCLPLGAKKPRRC